MKFNDQYIIPFAGQKEGQHNFDFVIQDEFYKEFPLIEAAGGNLEAKVIMIKKKTFLSFDVSITGTIKLQCDRCLDNYDQEVDFNGSLYVKFSDKPEEEAESDDVVFLHHEDHEIDLKQYFYESICLSLPYKRVHPDVNGISTCNSEMLKYIKNNDPEKDLKNNDINPIWDKLKDFNN